MRMVFPSHASGRLMDDLATDVGTLVESFFGDLSERGRTPNRARFAVPMDIDETEESYVVTMDVPGVALESISIDVHEDTLTIEGHRGHVEKESAEDTPSDDTDNTPQVKRLRRERVEGHFKRQIKLPLPIEADSVDAGLSDGVLVIRLPKADPEKGKRRVPISRG